MFQVNLMDFKNLSELRLIIYICINTENI